jgi:DNA-binding GntR family transcriptional regulator
MAVAAKAPHARSRTGKVESLRDDLLRMIVTGMLRPGDRINEVHLSRALGVSRGPLREAARALEAHGFVEARLNQGFHVTPFGTGDLLDVYEAKPWLDRAMIGDLATNAKRARLEDLLRRIERIDVSDRLSFAEGLFAFRSAIVRTLRNRTIAEQALVLFRRHYVMTAILSEAGRTDRIAETRATIANAWRELARGNADEAISLSDLETTAARRAIVARIGSASIPAD